MTEDLVNERIHVWDQGAWCLAALVLASRDDATAPLGAAARDVMAAVGLDLGSDRVATAPQLASQAAARCTSPRPCSPGRASAGRQQRRGPA